MQDSFIGNLRAANKNQASGLNGLRQTAQPASSSVGGIINQTFGPRAPKNTDQPRVDWDKKRSRELDTWQNGRYEMAVGEPEPTGRYVFAEPLKWNDIQRILPYKNMFDNAMAEYSKEPDSQKRLKIVDNLGNNTPLGTLPGIASYLRILRNTEEAVQREGISNYQYADTAEQFRKELEAEINKFYPRA